MIIDELNTIKYSPAYDKADLRGTEDPLYPRPWDIIDLIKNTLHKNSMVLDVGCGTGSKTQNFADICHSTVCLDINSSMVKECKNKIPNSFSMIPLVADANHLPFCGNSFDLITCLLSRWDVAEITRVLKENGQIIIEHLGPEDKKEFKTFFGKDHLGWRGQNLNESLEDFLIECHDIFNHYFEQVTINNGYWYSNHSYESLVSLLMNTPTIRNFNFEKDRSALDSAFLALSVDNQVRLKHNRILIHAKTPKKL